MIITPDSASRPPVGPETQPEALLEREEHSVGAMRWKIDVPRYASAIGVKRAVIPLVLAAMGSRISDLKSCYSVSPPPGVGWRLVVRIRSGSRPLSTQSQTGLGGEVRDSLGASLLCPQHPYYTGDRHDQQRYNYQC